MSVMNLAGTLFDMHATDDDRSRFSDILRRHNACECKECRAQITLAGCYAAEGETEAGTAFSAMSVVCTVCGYEVVCCNSWSCWYETVSDFLDELEQEWAHELH